MIKNHFAFTTVVDGYQILVEKDVETKEGKPFYNLKMSLWLGDSFKIKFSSGWDEKEKRDNAFDEIAEKQNLAEDVFTALKDEVLQMTECTTLDEAKDKYGDLADEVSEDEYNGIDFEKG